MKLYCVGRIWGRGYNEVSYIKLCVISWFSSSRNIGVKRLNEVYIFKETANTQRVTLQCGSPVNYQNINRVKLLPGDNYNVVSHAHNGMQLDVSINGNNNNFYSPINPY